MRSGFLVNLIIVPVACFANVFPWLSGRECVLKK